MSEEVFLFTDEQEKREEKKGLNIAYRFPCT